MPMPALSRTTGPSPCRNISPCRNVKLPRGALTSGNIACLNPRIYVSPGGAMRLALDADAIAFLARRRQRIAAQQSALVGPRLEPQYDKLPRQDIGQRLTVGRLQDERGDMAAFVQLARYPQ